MSNQNWTDPGWEHDARTDTDPRGFPPVPAQEHHPARRERTAAANELMSKYERKRQHRVLGALFVLCFTLIGVVAWYLLTAFTSIPQSGLFSAVVVGGLISLIITGLLLDMVYVIWTPKRDQSEHKATRVAVLGNALIVLVVTVIGYFGPGLRIPMALISFVTIVLPITLNKVRGNLIESELSAREELRKSAIPEDSRFALHYTDLPVHGGEVRSHPKSLIVWFAPTVVGVLLIIPVALRTTWLALVIALFVAVGIVIWRVILIQNEVYMFTDNAVTQHKGILEAEPDTVGYGDMKKKGYKIGFLSLWLAGNRYTKTKVGTIFFDTAAQGEHFTEIKEIGAVVAFYWLMFGRNKKKTP